MKIDLGTPLKDIYLSTEIIKFWDDIYIERMKKIDNESEFSIFFSRDKFPSWSKMEQENVLKLLDEINRFYNKECYENNQKSTKSNENNSLQLLNLLKKESIDFTSLLLNGFGKDWYIDNLYEMYIHYLDENNQEISPLLLEQVISSLDDNKKYKSYNLIDEEISIFLKMLNVTPNSINTYEWFSEKLQALCVNYDRGTGQFNDYSQHLRYECQNAIHTYISEKFPEHLNENNKYYKDIIGEDILSIQNFFQGSLDMNIYLCLKKYGLDINRYSDVSSIASECLRVVSSSEFMSLINEDIKVTNIQSKESGSLLKLIYSTDSQEDLDKFNNIFLTSLRAILPVCKEIKVRWFEDHDTGENTINTNMDSKFILHHYSHLKLQESLSKNNSKAKKSKL